MLESRKSSLEGMKHKSEFISSHHGQDHPDQTKVEDSDIYRNENSVIKMMDSCILSIEEEDMDNQSNFIQKSDLCTFILYDFMKKPVRLEFVRKVFSVIILQILLMAAIISTVLFQPDLNQYIRRKQFKLFWIGLGTFAFVLGIYCDELLRRKLLMNLVIGNLVILTLACGLEIGCISIDENEIILVTIGVAIIICMVLIIFSFQHKYDFGQFSVGIVITSFILELVIFCFQKLLGNEDRPGYAHGNVTAFILISEVAGTIFCTFLIYDLQKIIKQYQVQNHPLSPKEYKSAALCLSAHVVLIISASCVLCFVIIFARVHANRIMRIV